MDTARKIYAELKASFGNRWPIIGLVIAAVIARYDWLAHSLAGKGMTQLLGIPDWVAGIIFFCLWVTGTAVWHAVKLRQLVTPRLSVSFDPNGLGIVEGIEKITAPMTVTVAEIKQFRSLWVRVQLDTLTDQAINGCSAFITGLEFRANKREPFSEIKLPQPLPLSDSPMDVFPRIPRMIDFVKSTETPNGDRLLWVAYWPFILEDKLTLHGTYRYTISAYGPGGTVQIRVDVHWRGEWNTLTANKVKEDE